MSHLTIKIADFERDFSIISVIRSKVFHQEQGVEPELDFDGQDGICLQLLAYLNGEAIGTTRIRYLDENTAKIERLAVLPHARGQGIAKKLMVKALEVISTASSVSDASIVERNSTSKQNITAKKNINEILIHAQEYIKSLYEQLGFEQDGEVFVEAGINHVKMRKKFY